MLDDNDDISTENKILKEENSALNDLKYMTNRIVYGVGAFLIICFLSMTTCTMHSNTYDPERLREEAGVARVKVELEKYKAETIRLANDLHVERLKAIERMGAGGANPIAASCAILGFNNDDIGCVVAASKDYPNAGNANQ